MRTSLTNQSRLSASARLLTSCVAAGVLTLFATATCQAQAVMEAFTGNTAPENWELVPSSTGGYWFSPGGTTTASTLTIAGPVTAAGSYSTTVWMKSGQALGKEGYIVFNYDLKQNQAVAQLTVYRVDPENNWTSVKTLIGSGLYSSEKDSTPFKFGPTDRVIFELSSTLGSKPYNAWVNITPVPEPSEWAVAAGVGLLFYGFYRRWRRQTGGQSSAAGELK